MERFALCAVILQVLYLLRKRSILPRAKSFRILGVKMSKIPLSLNLFRIGIVAYNVQII